MAYPDYFPRRINQRVPNLNYAAGVSDEGFGLYRIDFGAVPTLSTTYFASAVLSTTAVALTLTVAAGTILNSGIVPGMPNGATLGTARWGRGLTFVGDGASTRTITLTGYDYLGQKIVWTGVLNGTTAVPVTKAFAYLESVVFGAAADTVSVSIGYNNTLGLPYQTANMVSEMKNDAAAANAGTLTAAIHTDPQTATTGDPRGTYLPLTVIPNGAVTFSIVANAAVSRKNLHGVAHYSV
jgi:hypothetical protein